MVALAALFPQLRRARPVPTVRVAQNDPGLAHAAAGAVVDRCRDTSPPVLQRLRRLPLDDVAAALRRHYGDLYIGELVDDERERCWFALAATAEAPRLAVVQFRAIRGARGLVWSACRCPLEISRHALARFMQRTLNHADVAHGGAALVHHVGEVALALDAAEAADGCIIRTALPAGLMIWRVTRDTGVLRALALTWIDAGQSLRADQAAACRDSRTTIVPAKGHGSTA